MKVLGVDIGGSGIKGGLVETSTGEMLSERIRLETPLGATPEGIAQTFARLVQLHDWSGPVGVGFPAAIQHGVARTAANIDPAFLGLPVAALLSEASACPVYVANDADVAAIAEMRFGAGRGHNGVVMVVTIGTGLGTAFFTKGQLFPNTELGHIFLANGRKAEHYASDAAREREDLKWKEWGVRFNEYLMTMEALFWPDLIILGGGASKKLDKYREVLKVRADVVAASFLNQAGIVGAALFAETQVPQN